MQNIVLSPISLDVIEQRFSSAIDQKLDRLLSDLKKQENVPAEYLTRKDAAKLLNISLPTLAEWTKTGLIEGYRIASRIRYKRSEIESALSRIKTRRVA